MLNGTNTKDIIFSTTKIKENFLQDFDYSFDLNNDKVEKAHYWKVLGMIFQENFSWEKHINQLLCTCYKKLFVLKKSKMICATKKIENILLKL